MTGVTGLSWMNYAWDATITAGSEEASLPGSNVATDQGAAEYAWQTLAGDVTEGDGATLTIKPVTLQQTWRVVVLARTNLTAGATVSVKLYNYGSPSDALVLTALASGPPAGVGQVCVVLAADTVADYLVIAISDAANPDGHINVPLVHCGALFRPEYGRTAGSAFDDQSRTDQFITIGGQEFLDPRWERRVASLVLDAIAGASEHWQQLAPLARQGRAGRNVLAIPDIASTRINEEAVLGTVRLSQRTFGMRTAERLTVTITVSERV